MTRNQTRFSVLFVSTVLALILCELLVRLAVPSSGLQDNQGGIFDKTLGQRGNPDWREHDENGFRNPVALQLADVVTLGDSQTYGSGVTSSQTWAQQLAALKSLAVYNMSFPGYGPIHYLLLFDRALSLKPKVIIATFFPGNDLYDAYSHVYRQNQLPQLAIKDKELLESINNQEATEPLLKKILNESDSRYWKFKKILEAPKKYFKTYAIATIGLRNALYRTPLSWFLIKNESRLTSEKQYIFESQINRAILAPSYRSLTVDLEDARLSEGLRLSQESFKQLNQKSKEAGIKFSVLLIPTKELAYKNLVQKTLVDIPKKYSHQTQKEERVAAALKTYLAQNDVSFIDTLLVFSEAIESGQKPYLEGVDGHLSEFGHAKIAQLVNYNGKI